MLTETPEGNKLYKTPVGDKKVAVVDVDDVLWPCTQILIDYCNASYGQSITMDENTGFDLELMYPEIGTKESMMDILLHKVDYMLEGAFYPYAKHLLEELQRQNYYVAVVTSRGFHPQGYQKTFSAFKEHGLPFDALATTKMRQSKLDFVLDYIDPDPYVVFEDNVSVMKEFQEYGTKVVKFDRIWNRSYVNHTHLVKQDLVANDVASLVSSL